MTIGEEAVRGLFGAYRLALGDRQSLGLFSLSAVGAARSLSVILFLIPISLLAAYAAVVRAPPELPTLAAYLLVYTLVSISTWLMFLLLVDPISRAFDRGEHYTGFVTVYNWSLFWQACIKLTALMLVVSGVMGGDAGSTMLHLVTIGILVYIWHIARVTLDMTAMQAGMVVATNLATDILGAAAVTSLFPDIFNIPTAP